MNPPEDYYKVLFETVGVGIAVLDERGVIAKVNAAFESSSGYSHKELEGRMCCSDLFPQLEEGSGPRVGWYKTHFANDSERFETRLMTKSGDDLAVYVTFRAVPHSRQTQLVVLDISEWVEMREKLMHAEKLSVVGQLISGVAHELNNPLTSVLGFSQLLQGKGIDGQANADVRMVWQSAQRAVRIVQNLRSIARRTKLKPSFVDVNEIIESTVELLDYELEVHDIEVRREFDLELPWTMADPHQVQQLLLNLMTNAFHAMRDADGKGVLTLRTATRRRPGPDEGEPIEVIQVQIRDTGPGIPEAVMPHIFEPFFTTKAVGKGTGLGLAISKGIVENHNGTIHVSNKPRVDATSELTGAVFTVELPVVERPADYASAEVVQAQLQVISGLRLLIVDDEEATRTLLERVFEPDGYTITGAKDGKEALDKLSSQEFDILVADLRMPRMSGQELFWHVERNWPKLATNTIFITGDIISPGTKHFLDRTDKPVLIKPFTVEEIRVAVAEVAHAALGAR